MDLKEIRETDVWTLYERGVRYCRLMGVFDDTDRNYRMYNGDQWYGLKVQGVEKVQYNFIKPIVRYKTGIVLTNLYAIVYSPGFSADRTPESEQLCTLLSRKAADIWERDSMDMKLRAAVKDAAINDEGIIYVTADPTTGLPVNELLNKTDIFYGNENDPDLQSQPYILIKQRKPVTEVRRMAENLGVEPVELQYIVGDGCVTEEAGEAAKFEADDMCTLVTKLWKEGGTVRFSQATRYVEIKTDADSGLTLYPVAHVLWEEKKGSARGEGEVRHLIPNQLETNKTAMRRAVTVKNTAYPQKVANMDKIANPAALDTVGGTVKVRGGASVDDVAKVFAHISPAQMSADVERLQHELIQSTRELAGAGEVVTGGVNPENASGRAILAVQQAAMQPLNEHLLYVKGFIEDLARIWLDVLLTYNESIELDVWQSDPVTGERIRVLRAVPRGELRALQTSVRVEITPKGAFDKFAEEQSMENLLTAGLFSAARMPELRLYAKALDDDSIMPKRKLMAVIEAWEEEQKKVAEIHAKAQALAQKAQRALSAQ